RAEGEDADDGRREQDARDVRPGEEVRAGDREERDEHDERAERERLLQRAAEHALDPAGGALLLRDGGRDEGRGAGRLVDLARGGLCVHQAACPSSAASIVQSSMMFSWVAFSLSRTPVMRPPAIATIRCERRSTSGSSDEMTMIDLPSRASSCRRA